MDMRPALPVDAAEDVTRVRVDTRTGTRYQECELVFTEYDIGRFKEGYCCINCLEAQERPFPMACPACQFPMRTEQSRVYAEQFDGPTTIGSRSLEELRAEDDEAKEKARRHREGKPSSMIWLPS